MTAQPLPRQSWETDADYQARLASWEGSATEEETPRANEGSVSETQKRKTNMSTIVTEAPVATYEISDELGKSQIYVWIGRSDAAIIDTPEEARAVAAVLLEAADKLDITTTPGARIVRWGFIPAVTEVVIYHRVTDGVDNGEIIIPMRDAEDSFAHELAALKPGETRESDYKLGGGFPKEHHSDTLVGVFRLKTRLSDDCAIVVPVAQTEVH